MEEKKDDTQQQENAKSEDKKDIESEEREQMLNAENKAHDKIVELDAKEGMEVKPKKIPIGGIQMPGFFTRSKSKEKCKETEVEGQPNDVEETELLSGKGQGPSQIRVKLSNLLNKSKTEDGKKEGERKKLIDQIRLPLVSVWPLKKREENLENQAAGLASMETLGDNDKSIEKGEELKNVPLDDKADLEKQDVAVEPTWKQKLKAYRLAISALLVFLLILIITIAVSVPRKPSFAAPIKDGKYVETVTSCGKVEGLIDDGAVAFRGIPYARPPIGELRFKRAQPLNDIEYCWNETVFIAHNATPTCLQIHSDGIMTGQEDCLTLDVVTPYVRYDSPLPVIVLIGAESFMGGSPGKMRPSARYARSKDVVFVRPNFRMGVLGFLALKVLSESDYPFTSGNYGLSDIIEALRWVRLNIEHFGGDRENIMVFGHRAGATIVTALSTTKVVKDEKLFTRAWATSGSALYPNKPLAESELANNEYLSGVQCETADCLRQKDAIALMNAVPDTWRKPQPDLPSKDELPGKRHTWLVLDGVILKEYPGEIWSKESMILPKGFVLGTTAHAAASDKLLMKHKEWTKELVEQHERESFLTGLGLIEEIQTLYNTTYKDLVTMISDIRIVCPLFAISSQMTGVPFYVATQTRGEQDLADIDSDVDAILGRYEPHTPEQRRYVSEIQNLFYHFVWHEKVPHQMWHGHKVIAVGQSVLSSESYSQCDFWIQRNVALPYAGLD